jgi:succinate dehydrogenase/fumarate reductase flavoprotein subunit
VLIKPYQESRNCGALSPPNIITIEAYTDFIFSRWDIQLVLDEGVYQKSASHIDFYIWKGLMHKTTIDKLGESALESIKEYSRLVNGSIEDVFGRRSFGHWTLSDANRESVVYVGRVTPAVHFTMGGILINERSEVLDVSGNSIGGLWAAGEVTGGVHGENRLGGSSLLECVVFGRIAGNQIAEMLS